MSQRNITELLNALQNNSPLETRDQLKQTTTSFRPWSRDDLFKRIETFSITSWFGKPLLLNQIECARFGWINVANNMLECTICHVRLHTPVPEPGILDSMAALNTVYVQQLNDSHREECPWRNNPCQPSIIGAPFFPSAGMFDIYVDAVRHLLSTMTMFPLLDMDSITKSICMPDFQSVLSALEDKLLMDVSPKKLEIAGYLSLCGWVSMNGASLKSNILACEYCRRRVELHHYTLYDDKMPPEDSHATENTVNQYFDFSLLQQTNNDHPIPQCFFNALSEHRSFCPWIAPNVVGQNEAGWKGLLQSVHESRFSDKASMQHRKMSETVKLPLAFVKQALG